MTPELEEALASWESGELSRDELARRFPEEDIAGVLDAFDRMSAAAVGPDPDASAAWASVRARLPARLADRRRGRGKAIRLLAAALIAVLTLGAAAYAVVPGVRRAVNDAAGVTTGDDDRSPGPARPNDTGSEAGQLTPNTPGDNASTSDADEGGAGENDPAADANETDASGDSNPGSNADPTEDGVEGDPGSETNDGSAGDGSGPDGGSIVEDAASAGDRASDAADGDGASSGSEDPDS